MKKLFQKNNTKKDKGFTILFAVLVSSLVLAVGSSIIALSFRQILLSGSARESQFAFYAANSGYECALYWDNNGYEDKPVFATSSNSVGLLADPNDIRCLGYGVKFNDATTNPDNSGQYFAEKTFTIWFNNDESDQCAVVTVRKDHVGHVDGVGGTINTEIDSYGYNTCDTSNPRRIERGLEVFY
jgi:hypothetical protein